MCAAVRFAKTFRPFTIPVDATFPYWKTMIFRLPGLPGSQYLIISLQFSSVKQDGKHRKGEHMFVEFQQPGSRGLLTNISVHGARPNSPAYSGCLQSCISSGRWKSPPRWQFSSLKRPRQASLSPSLATALPAPEFKSCVKKKTLLIVSKTVAASTWRRKRILHKRKIYFSYIQRITALSPETS